jgi:mannose-1-phosphate guanylyltransferase
LGIIVHISKEDEPLGTAGPLALAKKYLSGPDPFFVLNSDVISPFPFADLLKFHKSHGKEGTLMVTKVKDPSKYGVILSKADGQIHDFVEKPKEFVGDCINAGMYIFNSQILDRIEPKPTSIEREIFPQMAKEGQLYSFVLGGFWMDIGQPKDYLKGLKLYLNEKLSNEKFAEGTSFVGKVVVHPTAKIGNGCRIGPDVSIGPGCVIEDCVRIENSAVFEGSKVRTGAYVRSSIIGWNCTVGKWSHLQDGVVLGEDVQVGEGVVLVDVQVLPHKGLKEDELQARVIM